MKSMKCLFAVMLVLIMIFTLAACGNSSTDNTQSSSSGNSTPATSSTNEPITVRIGASSNRGSNACEWIFQFADALAAKTDKFVIEPYPGNQFGSNNEMITAVQSNILQGVVFPASFIAGVCPVVNVLDNPFLYPDHKTCLNILNEGIDVVTNGFQAAGFYPGCWIANGTYWTYSTSPINSVADLKGKNIRTASSDVLQDMCAAYGCNLVTMATADVPMALQQGAIDGAFGPLSVAYSMFLGSFKYMTPIHGNAVNTPDCCILSNEFIQSLSEEDRALFLATAKEVATGENYEMFLDYTDMYMNAIIDSGVQVIPDSEELQAQVREAQLPVKESFPAKYPDLADAYNQIVSTVETYVKNH